VSRSTTRTTKRPRRRGRFSIRWEAKIRELRAHAEETLGDAFDLRAFHDELLSIGAVPLPVLEEHMRRWVDEQSD
jgi:hypothetical protein